MEWFALGVQRRIWESKNVRFLCILMFDRSWKMEADEFSRCSVTKDNEYWIWSLTAMIRIWSNVVSSKFLFVWITRRVSSSTLRSIGKEIQVYTDKWNICSLGTAMKGPIELLVIWYHFLLFLFPQWTETSNYLVK